MKHTKSSLILTGLTLIIGMATAASVLAAEKADKKDEKKEPVSVAAPVSTSASMNEPGLGEQVNVEAIKEKYWARGDEASMGVVQNRLYAKENKLQFNMFSGFTSSDPFVDTRDYGFSLGYHFSEYFSLHGVMWRSISKDSEALTLLKARQGVVNPNPAHWYLGAEGMASIMYGKISLLGMSIIYYDMHLLGGLGVTDTASGRYLTPSIGIGQQIYLGKSLALGIDYRVMEYREALIEQTITNRLGQIAGYRNNWSHVITMGVSFLFGFRSDSVSMPLADPDKKGLNDKPASVSAPAAPGGK